MRYNAIYFYALLLLTGFLLFTDVLSDSDPQPDPGIAIDTLVVITDGSLVVTFDSLDVRDDGWYRSNFDTTFISCGIVNAKLKNDGVGNRFLLMLSKPTNPDYLQGMDLIDGIRLHRSYMGNKAFIIYISWQVDAESAIHTLLDYIDEQLCQIHQRII